MLKSKLFPHQEEALIYSRDRNKFLICDDMGLGKTLESLAIAIEKKGQKNLPRCLILCGVNATKYNWDEEVKRHTYEKSIIIDGTKKKRMELLNKWNDSDIFFGIINVEAIRQMDVLEYLLDMNIPMIILDEIHKCKNSQSKIGKIIHLFQATYKIGLTGTPIQNQIIDVFNLLKWIGAEKRNYFVFRNRYCILDELFKSQIIGYRNTQEIHKNLNLHMIRRLKGDVIDLPSKIYTKEYVEITASQKKIYKQNKEAILEMMRQQIDIPDNPLTLLITLRKITGGLLTKENPKMDRLIELVEELKVRGKKVVIFSCYKEIINSIKLELKSYNIKSITGETKIALRQEMINQFQEAKGFNILCGTIGAMGTGITLNTAEYVIFFDKDYSPSNNSQAEDRLHRIGQVNRVNIITLVTKKTIDEGIEAMLNYKRKNIQEVVDGKLRKGNLNILKQLLKD